MSAIHRPPVYPRIAGHPPEDVEPLLRAFFRSEVPEPWPAPAARDLRRVSAPVRRPRSFWYSRLGAAAAVILFVGGYLTLARSFPADQAVAPSMHQGRDLGSQGLDRLRPRAKHPLPTKSGQAVEPTRNGDEAILQWEGSSDLLFMRVEYKRPARR